MGKNKKQKQVPKEAPKEQAKEETKETATETVEAPQEANETAVIQAPPPVVKCPESMADEYYNSTLEVFNQYSDKFSAEIEVLQNESHLEELKARNKAQCEEEIQKYQKVSIKVINDMENITGPGATNFKVVRDKILAESFTLIKKMNEDLNSMSIKRG